MAIFRQRDREKRKTWKAYHASAINTARNHYAYSDPEDGDLYNINEAWYLYVQVMDEFGLRPLAREKFVKELMN